MENTYMLQCSAGTFVYEESFIKVLVKRTEINDVVIKELEQYGILLTKQTEQEVSDFWKKQEEARIKRENSCSCADCGHNGIKSEMEYAHNGYVCLSCWNGRAMKMM